MEPRALRSRRLTLSNYLLGVVGAALLGSCGDGASPSPSAESGAQAPGLAAPSGAAPLPSPPTFRQNLPAAYSQGTPTGAGQPPLGGTADANLQPQYSGCIAIHRTAVAQSCMVGPDSSLVLWIPQASCQGLQLTDGGRPLDAIPSEIEEGCQLRVAVPASPQSVTTLVVTDRRSQQPRLSIVLDRSNPNLLGWRRQVRAAATDDDLSRIVENLERTACPQAENVCQMERADALARGYVRQGRIEEARRRLIEAAEHASHAGYPSVAVDAEREIAILLQEAGKFPLSWDSLQRAQSYATPGYGKQIVELLYKKAGLLRAEGHLLEALGGFQNCSVYARRLSEDAALRAIVPLTTDLAIALGKFDDAERGLKLFPQILEGASTCQRAWLLVDQASIIHELVVAGLTGQATHLIKPMDAVEAFRKAKTALDVCPDSPYWAYLYYGWAYSLFHAGSLTEAKTYLGKAHEIQGGNPEIILGLLDLEGLIAFKEQHAEESLQLYLKLDAVLKQNPSFQQLLGGLFVCNQVLGASISNQALGRQGEVETLATSLQRCIDPEQSTLRPAHRVALCVQAKEAGLPIQAGACSR